VGEVNGLGVLKEVQVELEVVPRHHTSSVDRLSRG
jgi:hypothetical protein